ncbi:MAG: hypothetical protein ACRD1U_11870 [Vicinamibacterales bacterium]
MYIQAPTRRGIGHYGLGQSVGPFEGTFKGTIRGDEESSTSATATFQHRGNDISGSIVLGSGLKLRFNVPCGLEPVDIKTIPMAAKWDAAKPNHVESTTEVEEKTEKFPGITSIPVRVSIVGDLQSDGKTVNASVTLKPLGLKTVTCGSRTLDVSLTRS